MTRGRVIATGAAGAAVLALVGGIAVLRSAWLHEQVRQRIVSTIETATGGRVELGGFQFDWRNLRARVGSLTLHGTEGPGKPPLFHASSVTVGLEIVSAMRRDIDIESLDVADPHVYLVVYPDGRTNVPAPKVRGRSNAMESILALAVGRFSLTHGILEVESRGSMPFDVRGRNLAAHLAYDASGPRYRGAIAADPLDLTAPGGVSVPFSLKAAVDIERNRIALTSGAISTANSRAEFSGALDDLRAPRAALRYDARVSLADVARVFRVPELRAGNARTQGSASWTSGAGFAAEGNVSATGVEYRDSSILIRGGRLDGAVRATPEGIDVSGARVAAVYHAGRAQAPAEGRIDRIALRGRAMDLRGVAISILGGGFRGEVALRNWRAYSITGQFDRFDARRLVALYSPETLPWDGIASGRLRVEGTLGRRADLRAQAEVKVAPAPDSAPVQGSITAAYDARSRLLDLGQSTLTLPSSRADFEGVFGRQLRVHLETGDLHDLLPLLGAREESLPVRLDGGRAVFDGKVSGSLDAPSFSGHVAGKRVQVEGRVLDAFEAGVDATADTVVLRSAVASVGAARLRFDAQAQLHGWKLDDSCQIYGNGRVENAPASDLLAVAGAKDVRASGALTGSAQLTGTVAKPIVKGEAAAVKGEFRGEPFDRAAASFSYVAGVLQIAGAHVTAGAKQLDASGTWRRAGDLLRFQVSSNAMPLAEIATVQQSRPGARGTVQVTANGAVELGDRAKVIELHADLSGRGLQLADQQLGDAHIKADTDGGALHTVLDANFANSAVHGDGRWQLEGEYPGSAKVTFSRLDFAQLRAWLSPSGAGSQQFSGFAEGEMTLSGPALRPEAMKAELRLPRVEVAPASTAPVPPSFALRNSGPIVATLADSVLTVRSARLTGRATDFSISGRVLLRDSRNPLDLRLKGRIDLSAAQDFDPDVLATGALLVDAGLRGTPDDPQITGRMQAQDVALNVVDFPNGISKANGSLLFSGRRATIEKLTGETGGGRVELSGFIALQGERFVFQLGAAAKEVRLRYPEGVSTVADANLRLAGTSDRSTLTGSISILRTGFNPQSDFSSLIATSAEPMRTPPARAGLIGGISYDVQIETAPDAQFQSSLTQDLQVEANLRLRGNAANPALIGRISITHGQVVFYGTRYSVNQGTISFYNPLKIDPIFDVDLETKARGIDVTLTVSGPLNKLNLTPRSDPPLQFNEIVALLATGRAPTSDPTLLARQATAPQSWQQMGASALLGQAIANPVAGRLQRFFGVSNLRIDPTLPGVENNPQARLTVEQQVTRDVTLTYVTNLTSINSQVVRIEWAWSKQWSAVALREENGVYSVDFFYKRRF